MNYTGLKTRTPRTVDSTIVFLSELDEKLVVTDTSQVSTHDTCQMPFATCITTKWYSNVCADDEPRCTRFIKRRFQLKRSQTPMLTMDPIIVVEECRRTICISTGMDKIMQEEYVYHYTNEPGKDGICTNVQH